MSGISEVIDLVGDVRDRARMDEIIAQVRPGVIFHVAAQRSPALAEAEAHRTVSTNVLGSRTAAAAAAAAGVPQVVCASTGKALRPYSPEMYTASKRAAEWTASVAAASGELLVSAARFTHVVDNSIVYERLLDWAAAHGGASGGTDLSTGEADVVRLHGESVAFYVQSALESAQLLQIAYLGAKPGEFRVHAITDLGLAKLICEHEERMTPVHRRVTAAIAGRAAESAYIPWNEASGLISDGNASQADTHSSKVALQTFIAMLFFIRLRNLKSVYS